MSKQMRMTMNIGHYPNIECRICHCKQFKPYVEIKRNPLNHMEMFIIPVYGCANCNEILEIKVTPKKHNEQ